MRYAQCVLSCVKRPEMLLIVPSISHRGVAGPGPGDGMKIQEQEGGLERTFQKNVENSGEAAHSFPSRVMEHKRVPDVYARVGDVAGAGAAIVGSLMNLLPESK
ncbi:hypothetical protein J6590_002749 [Homalodisca vitripennis]|nr:hypothetical protein J6590_002749 [Homalodisca vitripennis]